MIILERDPHNPILLPSNNNIWEAEAAFNGCVIKDEALFHMVYRAISPKVTVQDNLLEVSTIGYAQSSDGVMFDGHRQLIKPEQPWELYGCEDPRITKLGDTYYIFYTALSKFPFEAAGIKVAVATTKDLQTIEAKHLVTPFNAKAMSLFPEKINGKYAVILTANTDIPPSKVSIAYFDSEEEIWSPEYWHTWYEYVDDHTVPLQRNSNDQVEIGAPPIKTKDGWLLLYAYIRNYFSDQKIFGIEAALLDLENPQKVISRIEQPLLTPGKQYELFGHVPNVIFPSGGVVADKKLYVYYGAADTSCALATCNLDDLLIEFDMQKKEESSAPKESLLERFAENPILEPIASHAWESKAVFNPAAFYLNGKFHILYRAMSNDNISVVGYAVSTDGFHIDERLENPIYVPREVFEKNSSGANSGCEDPRVMVIDDRIYMCYTAYDGANPPRVAMSSISVEDFLQRRWHWAIPKLISPPDIDDKDACILSKKVNDNYMVFHRMETFIWIDFVKDLHFYEGNYLGGRILLQSRKDSWDCKKIGIAAPPIETEKGWLLLYHGISQDTQYRLGAVLLDKDDPTKVLGRSKDPILEPVMKYEKEGLIPNVVFPCGAVVKDGILFVYYGGADTVLGVATAPVDRVLASLLE
jgi:beta-1,2-mannobiose phosphorylase / 1,2-beta-oligomannan phosphorylase